jgi:hypothetical protein
LGIRAAFYLFLLCSLLPRAARAQSELLPDAPQPVPQQPDTPQANAQKPGIQAQDLPNYTRPSKETRFRVYTFDLIGPYPLIISATTAGLHQAQDSPPEWSQGFDGYARRFGSSFGIGVVETSTRYALAEATGEDTLYYECDCKGFKPRLRHALISSVTGRRGEDGLRAISIPSIVAPYAGAFTAAYAWYPRNYGFGDGLRMGTYGFLGYVAGNISLEFLYGGPHSLLARAHLSIPSNAANPGESPSSEQKPDRKPQ